MNKKLRANLLLFGVAVIWGFGFVATDRGADLLEPVTFNAFRMALAGLSLLPILWWQQRRGQSICWKKMRPEQKKSHLLGGFLCGLMLFFGAVLQQIGIERGVEPGKAGFIAALYILFVPLFGVFQRKKIGVLVWLAVAFGTVGLYFLCIQNGFQLGMGDAWIIVSSMFYAGHILVVDAFNQRNDCLWMSLIQFATSAVICTLVAAFTEHPTWQAVLSCAIPLLYMGIAGSGVAFTMQMLGQRDASPTTASLILSMESVFAVIGGWLLLGEVLTARELLGCALMMTGIVLAQLPQKQHSAL